MCCIKGCLKFSVFRGFKFEIYKGYTVIYNKIQNELNLRKNLTFEMQYNLKLLKKKL